MDFQYGLVRGDPGTRPQIRHSRETGCVKRPTSGVRKANPSFPRKRESRGGGRVLQRRRDPLHPAWIPAFAGMTISGVCASLGSRFDTAWKAGIQGRGQGEQRRLASRPWIPAFAGMTAKGVMVFINHERPWMIPGLTRNPGGEASGPCRYLRYSAHPTMGVNRLSNAGLGSDTNACSTRYCMNVSRAPRLASTP